MFMEQKANKYPTCCSLLQERRKRIAGKKTNATLVEDDFRALREK